MGTGVMGVSTDRLSDGVHSPRGLCVLIKLQNDYLTTRAQQGLRTA